MKSTYKIKRENLKLTTLGFTLIELIAVLVILAILALIVTPLVMNIIRKARISADKRSVDAYGRSVELAIANYLLDNGDFPTDVSQLTIEYSGDEVVCEQAQLNSDSSVYLAGCTVNGRSVEGYTYGKGGGEEPTPTGTVYSVGDEVTYNNINYYVIKDSASSDTTVTLLKVEPLTVAEVNQFGGVGTANNHVNKYIDPNFERGTATDQNGYGAMAYYSSPTCGYDEDNNFGDSGCTTDYESSEIKYVVDAWKNANAPQATEARLITKDEIDNNFEVEEIDCCGGCGGCIASRIKDNLMYDGESWYWTMSEKQDSTFYVWHVAYDGIIGSRVVCGGSGSRGNYGVVRPVITLNKSALN